MSDGDDIEGLAAEYVLGTLDAAERQAVGARRRTEPELDSAIRAWEARLSPLSEHFPQAAPPSDLYPKILARLDSRPRVLGFRAGSMSSRRILVGGISALAASLLVFVGWLLAPRNDGIANLNAQLHRVVDAGDTADETLAAFFVSLNSASKVLTIKPGSVRPVPERTYLLSLAAQAGGSPIRVGVISPYKEMILPWPSGVPLQEAGNMWLLVSIEPASPGSATSPPGRVIFKGQLASGRRP